MFPFYHIPTISSITLLSVLPPVAPFGRHGNFCTAIMLSSKASRHLGQNCIVTTRWSFSGDLRVVQVHGVKRLASTTVLVGALCCTGWRKMSMVPSLAKGGPIIMVHETVFLGLPSRIDWVNKVYTPCTLVNDILELSSSRRGSPPSVTVGPIWLTPRTLK